LPLLKFQPSYKQLSVWLIGQKYVESVATFKYLGSTLTYHNCFREEIKDYKNRVNGSYHSVPEHFRLPVCYTKT